MRRALGALISTLISILMLSLGAGCGRWQPAKSYDVATQRDPGVSFSAVLEVASAEKYKVVAQDPAAKTLRLEAKISGDDADEKSFIDVAVAPGNVRLAAAGRLVRDGKVHKALLKEVTALQRKLKDRLEGTTSEAAPLAAASAPPPQQPGVDASKVPQAWSEPAYDPSVWGNGNFTCLPVQVPMEHQAALSLQLSNGEKADVQLSLAYAPELCRSPAQCKQPGGCPALGIGDTERVGRLAGRLQRGEVAPQATLLDGGQPVVTIDLSKHGSIVQAQTEIKRP